MEVSHLEVIKRTLTKKDKEFSGSATLCVQFDAKSPLQLEDLKNIIQKRLTSDLVGLCSNFGFGGNIILTEAKTSVDNLEELTQSVSKGSVEQVTNLFPMPRHMESLHGSSIEGIPRTVAS